MKTTYKTSRDVMLETVSESMRHYLETAGRMRLADGSNYAERLYSMALLNYAAREPGSIDKLGRVWTLEGALASTIYAIRKARGFKGKGDTRYKTLTEAVEIVETFQTERRTKLQTVNIVDRLSVSYNYDIKASGNDYAFNSKALYTNIRARMLDKTAATMDRLCADSLGYKDFTTWYDSLSADDNMFFRRLQRKFKAELNDGTCKGIACVFYFAARCTE